MKRIFALLLVALFCSVGFAQGKLSDWDFLKAGMSKSDILKTPQLKGLEKTDVLNRTLFGSEFSKQGIEVYQFVSFGGIKSFLVLYFDEMENLKIISFVVSGVNASAKTYEKMRGHISRELNRSATAKEGASTEDKGIFWKYNDKVVGLLIKTIGLDHIVLTTVLMGQDADFARKYIFE